MTDNEVRLFFAVQYGDLKTIRVLQALKVSLTIKDIDNRTPLHVAASEGYLNIVQYLLLQKADVLAMDSRQNDPRMDAIN